MRIAFVSANRETLPDAVIPLGLLCVVASMSIGHNLVLRLSGAGLPARAKLAPAG
jgi:hypothetical protein